MIKKRPREFFLESKRKVHGYFRRFKENYDGLGKFQRDQDLYLRLNFSFPERLKDHILKSEKKMK